MAILQGIRALIYLPFIAETIKGLGLAGAIGGGVATYGLCHRFNGKCVKRGLLGLDFVPKINIGRADVGPCGVPAYNFDICRDQLHGVQVMSSIPQTGVARFENIPPACMDLAVVLSGSCTGEGTRPVPCGSACMEYTGLTEVQLESLSISLNPP